MIRVAVVMGKMHSGGKKNLVMEYYRHIDKTKVQFDFICDEDSNAVPTDEIEAMGGRVYIIPPYQNLPANLKAMTQICRENNYKIMHSYNSTMNLFAMYVGWKCKIPIRINESISMGHKSDKKNVLKAILKPFSTCFSTHFMANGEVCGRWQFGDKLCNEGKVKIFKTVIDTHKNRFQPRLREQTRSEFDLKDKIVIGHIGRLTAQKNTLFIIDIFAAMCKKEPTAKLLIIGDGELKETMLARIDEKAIKDKVLYLGRREDIQQFYNAMDCFLLPSLYEGLPVVGVEAECAGVPIFFSTEIPEESSPCNDIGYFIGLKDGAEKWAEIVLEETKRNMPLRCDRSEEVKAAGFDSQTEGERLGKYNEQLVQQYCK